MLGLDLSWVKGTQGGKVMGRVLRTATNCVGRYIRVMIVTVRTVALSSTDFLVRFSSELLISAAVPCPF